MSVSVRMVRAAAPTSPGDQDFTIPGMGTPKAAIFIITAATVNAVSAAGAAFAFGIATGAANRFCISSSSQDNLGNSNTANIKTDARCILLLTADGAIDAVADFVSFDPGGVNGVRINWSNAPATAVLVTVCLFSGDDFSAYAGDFLASAFVNENTVVGDPLFPPDQIILLGTRAAAYSTTTPAVAASMQIGFADRATPITQSSLNWYAPDNTNTSEGHDYVSTLRASVGGATALGQNGIEITAFSATGFTATTRTAGAAFRYSYLALKYNGVNGACGHTVLTASSPTGAGVQSQATTFRPQFVMQLVNGVNVINFDRITGTSNSPGAGTYGIAAFTATELFSNSIGDDDAASTMNTESFATTDFRCRSDIQTNIHVAATPVFNPTNYSLNYSIFSSTIRFWPTLVIGEFITGGPVTHQGEASLISSATVSAAARLNLSAAATVTAVGSAAAAARAVYAGQAALSSACGVVAVGLVTRRAEAVLSATFTTSAAGRLALPGQSVLAGVFALGASPSGFVGGTATLASTFTMSAGGIVTFAAAGELVSVFNVTADGTIVASAAAALSSGFTIEATATSIHAAGAALTAQFTIAPLGSVVYQCAAAVSGTFTVAALGSLASEAPSGWQNYGVPRLYRAAKNAGLAFGLQVDMRAIMGAVNARLYNMTDSEIVSGSELTTVSSAFELLTTPALALEDNKYYVPQLALSVGGTGEVKSAVPAAVN